MKNSNLEAKQSLPGRRYLVVAYACEANGQAEAKFGWDWCRQLLKFKEPFTVFISSKNKENLENYIAENDLDIEVVAFGRNFKFLQSRFFARFQVWVDYTCWCWQLPSKIKPFIRDADQTPTIIHASLSTWRVFPCYSKLNAPLIVGPIGGGEYFPYQFFNILAVRSAFFECIRKAQGYLSQIHLTFSRPYQKASVIFASNQETKEVLINAGIPRKSIHILSSARFSEEDINEKFIPPAKKPDTREGLNIFAGGSLEGRKGVSLAIRALRSCHDKGLRFKYIIGGRGAELKHLEDLRDRLGLNHCIEFHDAFSGSEYIQHLQRAHLYLLPSLRDSAGLTMMEAMLCGAVPIVLDCGGPGMIVSDDAGIKIPVSNSVQVVTDIVSAVSGLYHNEGLFTEFSKAARARIAESFSEEAYSSAIRQRLFSE
ncbi:MAG: glycosyltransferase family 4 protein [Verrucomicrobiota bacterium]